MATQVDTTDREALLMEDAHIRPMMGLDILEPLLPVGIAYHPVATAQEGASWSPFMFPYAP